MGLGYRRITIFRLTMSCCLLDNPCLHQNSMGIEDNTSIAESHRGHFLHAVASSFLL
jgi:hypothetical protein